MDSTQKGLLTNLLLARSLPLPMFLIAWIRRLLNINSTLPIYSRKASTGDFHAKQRQQLSLSLFKLDCSLSRPIATQTMLSGWPLPNPTWTSFKLSVFYLSRLQEELCAWLRRCGKQWKTGRRREQRCCPMGWARRGLLPLELGGGFTLTNSSSAQTVALSLA